MYSFVNLLLRHLLFSLLFISAILASSAVYLSFYLEAKTTQSEVTIKQYIINIPNLASQSNKQPNNSLAPENKQLVTPTIQTNNSNQDAAPLLIKNLPLYFPLKSLEVSSLYSTLTYNNPVENLLSINTQTQRISKLPEVTHPYLVTLFDNYFPMPLSTVDIKSLNLQIKYQLDITHELQLFNAFSLIVFTASFLITLLSLSSTLLGRRLKNRKLDQMISYAIENIGGTVDKESQRKYAMMKSAFPKTSEVLQLLEAQYNTTASTTLALENQAFFDPITKLENRNRFVQFYTEQVNNGNVIEFGMLIVVRAHSLQAINQKDGYHEGDVYICKLTELIKKPLVSVPDARTFRLNTSDFAIVLPNITQKSAEDLAKKFSVSFNEYQQSTELEAIAYSGIASFTKDLPLGELLALVDTSISIAQAKQINAWHCQSEEDILSGGAANLGNLNWRDEITSVIDNQRIRLLSQPIKPSGKNKRVYYEIISRFVAKSGEILPTASFFAMADKLDKISLIDRLIVEKSIELIVKKSLQDNYYGINISARTMQDEQFIVWLERRLLRDPAIAAKLIFEISEKGLQQNIANSKRLISMIHRVGARVTVERFGVGLTSFKLFRNLKPDFIKMDSSYTRDIDEDKNNQYFLRLMIDLAHRLSIIVLAENVESQNERFMLEKLFVDGCQGFYIGKPEEL